ncbi:MAG: acyl-ACP--UDP-N-acetylglucosamine O-acyltransferase [Desulfobacterales bacterium]|nr:acyl-ACP--UDP-N-acetylglucosamine O-acyltransferase [Desulfobacterales bacterium]
MIHATAVVDSKTNMGSDVEIGAYTIVKENVTIGSGTKIGPHVVIDSNTIIGEKCHIFQFAAIGAIPQDLKFKGEDTYVKIGNGSIIREFVTIHRGTLQGHAVTEIGEENLLMAYTHVAHDCKTGRRVVLANNATLAGHIEIGSNAVIGGLVAIHQFTRVGDYAFIGGKSAVVKDIPPYVIAAGDRCRLHGMNSVGLNRQGFPKKTISLLKKAYKIVFRMDLTLNEAIEQVQHEIEQLPEIVNFIEFIKGSKRGLTR